MNPESNQNNNLPALPTASELDGEQIRLRDEELAKYWLDPTQDYPEPRFLFEAD